MSDVEHRLRERVRGEVRFDAGSRATYATDASNYRQVPVGVVLPQTVDDGAEAVAVCRSSDVPVLSRGGGTSLAGQCCNEGVVIDWSKYCHRLVSVDAQRKTAVVEPGIVLDELNRQLAADGLMVGPKPSTHSCCTIGGMIGNNSCGATAQAYGKMADSVLSLEILTYDGLRMWVGETDQAAFDAVIEQGGERARLFGELRALRDEYLADIRHGFPDIPRRVSGYNLDALLPENGFHVARALVGSESTLVTVLRAELQLVDVPSADALAVIGFDDVVAAADAVPDVLTHEPAALEGIDARLVNLERAHDLAEPARRRLPHGQGWLLAQFNGDDQDAADAAARRLVDEYDGVVLDDEQAKAQMWQAREAGLGASAYPPDAPETHEGWEDAAVPPAKLGDYLRDFRSLLEEYGYGSASLYGHFGHGCVHTRIPFDLTTADGIDAYRRFVTDAAHLVVAYGGSLSGEHGDGQSRGELLPIMFDQRIMDAFSQLKALFDPADRMNPGKVVAPRPLDANLRQGVDYTPLEPPTHFAYPDDGHRFSHAAARCVGVGKCRSAEGGVMCPSYRATREEEHSTRGRSRLLFEMLQDGPISDGWRSEAVHDALDLCLACKGCRSDCPVNVDMATYKAEFLSHYYARRVRPPSHYSMGWLPVWAAMASRAPRAVNRLTGGRLSGVVKAAGGIDRRRALPRFAGRRFTDTFTRSDGGDPVLLWPDTFTNNFEPEIAEAAANVLQAARFDVQLPAKTVCCGLTWISTGQLATAKRVARRTLRVLEPHLRAGTPIVVLEPSCAAALRVDLRELLHGDQDVERMAGQVHTLAEILSKRDWTPVAEGRVMAQPHCHQHAVLGFDADSELLKRSGADVDVLDAGCCGLAGNFGFERGHYDVSVACAEDALMPAVRSAEPGTTVLADGFSCRTQIRHLAPDVEPRHLAELLAAEL